MRIEAQIRAGEGLRIPGGKPHDQACHLGRLEAWSLDTGDESRRTYFGWAVALARNVASTRTTATVNVLCLIGRPPVGSRR